MSVERRYYKRYPLQADVYIRYRGQRVFPARSKECSPYGISLETAQLTLLSGAMVELDIIVESHSWRVVGLVTHTQKDGLGVMYLKAQPDLYDRAVGEAQIPSEPGIPASKGEALGSMPGGP